MVKRPLFNLPLLCLVLGKAGFSLFTMRQHTFFERQMTEEGDNGKEKAPRVGVCPDRSQVQCQHPGQLTAAALRTAYVSPHCFHRCCGKFMNLELKPFDLLRFVTWPLCHDSEVRPVSISSQPGFSDLKLVALNQPCWETYTTEKGRCYKRTSC